MFDKLQNIFDAIKGFFGFFESVKVYIVYSFHVVKSGLSSVVSLYAQFPFGATVTTLCLTATLVFVVMRMVNRK